jgi:hypothetical protein
VTEVAAQEVIDRRRLLKAGSPSEYFQSSAREVLCDGTTRSAKTWTILLKANAIARAYPGSRQLICRQTRKSLNESVLQDWRTEILWPGHEAISPTASKEHQENYGYKNGSVVFFAGMESMQDTAAPLLSTKWDRIYIIQAEETSKGDCETLITRLSSFKTPYHQITYDCNPAAPSHWLNQRFAPDKLDEHHARFQFRHYDNPFFYVGVYPNGSWTKEGAEYISILESSLTGVRRERFLKGLWVAAEGQILNTWDPRIHSIDATLEGNKENGFFIHPKGTCTASLGTNPIRIAYFTAGVDFGWNPDPGVLQLWAYDSPRWHPLVRRFRVAEVMKLEWQREEWAALAEEWWEKYDVKHFSCDPADPENINYLKIRLSKKNYRNAPPLAIKCPPIGGGHQRAKHHTAAIDLMREGLKSATGHVRSFFLKDAFPEGVDEQLRRLGRATCYEQEVESWVYELDASGNPTSKPSRAPGSHGNAIYAAMYDEQLSFVRGFGRDLVDNVKPPYDSIQRIVWEEDQELKQDLRNSKKRRAPWE